MNAERLSHRVLIVLLLLGGCVALAACADRTATQPQGSGTSTSASHGY
jgi:hypothetical protein